MGIITSILASLATIFAGLNVYQLFCFRAYKAKYRAEAAKEQAEAEKAKQSALEERLKAIEELYSEQGKTIDTLRNDILTLSKEKFESEKRIVFLEEENKTLRDKVEQLEKEVNAYKTIAGK